MEPTITKTRAAYRAPTDSRKKNLFTNQVFHDINSTFNTAVDTSEEICRAIEDRLSFAGESSRKLSCLEKQLKSILVFLQGGV